MTGSGAACVELAAGLVQFLRRLERTGGASRGQVYVGAQLQQADGGCLADTTRPSSDDGRLAIEPLEGVGPVVDSAPNTKPDRGEAGDDRGFECTVDGGRQWPWNGDHGRVNGGAGLDGLRASSNRPGRDCASP